MSGEPGAVQIWPAPPNLVPTWPIGDTVCAMIMNLWRHRGFIARNALSDVRNRYAYSAAAVGGRSGLGAQLEEGGDYLRIPRNGASPRCSRSGQSAATLLVLRGPLLVNALHPQMQRFKSTLERGGQ